MATVTLDFATPHLLRNAREYRAAVADINVLLDTSPRRGTDAYDRLEFLNLSLDRVLRYYSGVSSCTTRRRRADQCGCTLQ